METVRPTPEGSDGDTLKPSLVEWKHPRACFGQGVLSIALKPSLVEWKQVAVILFRIHSPTLETFLSGMETIPRVDNPIRGLDLETFLSGMETARGSAVRVDEEALKPSLVEWKLNATILGRSCLSVP